MVLDLFKRIETRKGLFAVEKIALIYNLLTLSIDSVPVFSGMDHPWHMLLDRGDDRGNDFFIDVSLSSCPCKFSAFVRIVIQDESAVLLVSGYFRVQSVSFRI